MSSADVARKYFEAIAAPDLDAALALWAPGGTERLVGQRELTAPDGVRELQQELRGAFPDLHWEVLDVIGGSDGANRVAVRWRATGKTAPLKKQADILNGEEYLPGYINSGLLLMDCDAIRATEGVQDAMEDMVAAQGYPTVDQDRINIIFKGRITHLDPAWNCSWGRLALQRRDNGDLRTTAFSKHPIVLHFHGPNKPWQRIRMSTLKKGMLSTWRYRREMADFARKFPDLSQRG